MHDMPLGLSQRVSQVQGEETSTQPPRRNPTIELLTCHAHASIPRLARADATVGSVSSPRRRRRAPAHACHAELIATGSHPVQAKEHASTSRAAVILAAAFCAAFIPYTTKPCTAGKLAEVEHAVANPPQWLPVFLASGCTPHFVIGDVRQRSATASMVPAIVTLDGVQIGHPIEDSPCDQIAAIGVSDGVVRGVSTQIDQGFSVPIIGTVGEQIEFRYWRAAEGKEYFPRIRVLKDGVEDEYTTYTMVANGQIGSFAPGGAAELILLGFDPCSTCSKYMLAIAPGFTFPVDLAAGEQCVTVDGTCTFYSTYQGGTEFPCVNADQADCTAAYPPSAPPPPPACPPNPCSTCSDYEYVGLVWPLEPDDECFEVQGVCEVTNQFDGSQSRCSKAGGRIAS